MSLCQSHSPHLDLRSQCGSLLAERDPEGLMADSCLQDEHGLKSKDSGQSSLDGESASDNEDQSQGDPSGPPGKRRMRKIPKLPMVRHGRKWYRARLLKDSGQRVQIGEFKSLWSLPCCDPVSMAFCPALWCDR